MRITVQVRPEVADVLERRAAFSAERDDLIRLAQELGVTLEPLHPGVADLQLKTFFSVEVADPETAARALAQFQQNPAVLAAYIKPLDALP